MNFEKLSFIMKFITSATTILLILISFIMGFLLTDLSVDYLVTNIIFHNMDLFKLDCILTDNNHPQVVIMFLLLWI